MFCCCLFTWCTKSPNTAKYSLCVHCMPFSARPSVFSLGVFLPILFILRWILLFSFLCSLHQSYHFHSSAHIAANDALNINILSWSKCANAIGSMQINYKSVLDLVPVVCSEVGLSNYDHRWLIPPTGSYCSGRANACMCIRCVWWCLANYGYYASIWLPFRLMVFVIAIVQ